MASKWKTKVYVVQPYGKDGKPVGEPIDAKLTYAAAHEVARANAPAKVIPFLADKAPTLTGPAQN